MTFKDDNPTAAIASDTGASADRLVAAGSVLGAVAASSCCILPLILVSLGVGGAWMSRLTALAPVQPYLIALTVGLLAYGYWHVYRRSRVACADDQACARPASNRLVVSALVVATILVIAAIGFNIFVPYLL